MTLLKFLTLPPVVSFGETLNHQLPRLPKIGDFIFTKERGSMEIGGKLGEGVQGVVFDAYWESHGGDKGGETTKKRRARGKPPRL